MTFECKPSLDLHKRQMHPDVYRHQCNYCQAVFKEKQQRDRHHRIHTGEKPFVCNQCKRAFNKQGNLMYHIVVKHTKRNWKEARKNGLYYNIK